MRNLRVPKTDSQFADPGFVDPSKNDFHLQVGSAAIHAGRSAGVRVVGERGLDGGGRVNGSSIERRLLRKSIGQYMSDWRWVRTAQRSCAWFCVALSTEC